MKTLISLSTCIRKTDFIHLPNDAKHNSPFEISICMAFSSLFSLNFTPISSPTPLTKQHISYHSYLPSDSLQYRGKKRGFPPPSVASIPDLPPNVDYLEDKFSGQGVTFEGLGDCCIAKLRLENGSTATLMLPSGLITSYKAQMWHGGTMELLQTSVLDKDGSAVIQGGASSAFNIESEGGISWSPSAWALQNISGNSEDSIKVELLSTDAEDMVEVRCIISLKEDTLITELVVSNSKSSPIHLTGSFISHLTVSTPEATFAYGLEGSNFYNRPMLVSNFSIVPPDLYQESGLDPEQMWSNLRFKGFLWSAKNQKNPDMTESTKIASTEDTEGEEDDNYKNLSETMSRIYTSAPRFFTVIDRGRRNSVVVGRDGLDEVYLFSPGSSHESYGMYSYICLGQSALLKPVVLSPREVWTGAQHLHNPNL